MYAFETPPQLEAGASRQSYHSAYTWPSPSAPLDPDTATSGSQSSNPAGLLLTRCGVDQPMPSPDDATNASR